MLSRLFLFLVVLGLFCGCEVQVDPKQGDEQPVVMSFSDESLKANLVPLKEPDKYALDLSWDKTELETFIKLKTDYEYTQVSPGKISYRLEFDGGSAYEAVIEWRSPEGKF